ncbi:hypothetical protein P43SY_006821 [Pythium insidiosum]|uniref:TLC domain-containing protein n=1 Tax=Pythium insidiosum TaxID=114742 RepID=A0AAD5LLY1_PYTIN|nr:hypothetical protein P43SY_006821 [Pythium insidiosum]
MPSSDVYLLEEEHHVRFAENLAVAAAAFVFFWAVFGASWVVSSKRVPAFAAFTPAQKADWCSRINSTIHAVAVIAGVAVALANIEWGDDFMPMSSIRIASFVFSFAIGYFTCDLIVVLVWPVPMQWVFIIHHIVAVVPYAINNFISCCGAAQFGLLLFLLVELATLPLNVRGFIESMGQEDTRGYKRAIYMTYIVWAVSRTVLPIFLLYSFWRFTFPSERNHDVCFYPNMIGAHIIAFFCIGVFFFVHTPEMLQLRKDDKSKKKALLPTTQQPENAPQVPPSSSRDVKKLQQLASGSYDEVNANGDIENPPSSARAFS